MTDYTIYLTSFLFCYVISYMFDEKNRCSNFYLLAGIHFLVFISDYIQDFTEGAYPIISLITAVFVFIFWVFFAFYKSEKVKSVFNLISEKSHI